MLTIYLDVIDMHELAIAVVIETHPSFLLKPRHSHVDLTIAHNAGSLSIQPLLAPVMSCNPYQDRVRRVGHTYTSPH
jgi:hypothetical protein